LENNLQIFSNRDTHPEEGVEQTPARMQQGAMDSLSGSGRCYESNIGSERLYDVI